MIIQMIIKNYNCIVKLPDYVNTLATDFTINVTPIGKCIPLATSRVFNGTFEVISDTSEEIEFYWTVFGKRGTINVEPKKSDTVVNGDGPYRWI